MKRIMEAIKNAASTVFLYIIGTICLILFFIFAVFYIPVDYIRYKRSPYYKIERIKYSFFDGTGDGFKLYNEIAENELPIEYFQDPKKEAVSLGKFVYNGILLISDCCYNFTYNPEEEKWGWWDEGEDGDEESKDDGEERQLIMGLDEFIKEEINSANTAMGKEICSRAVVVTCEKNIENNLEEARKEPRFLLYDDSRVEALKRFCQENA